MDNPQQSCENKNKDFLLHEGNDLQEVMADVFAKYPEESFYFLNEGNLKQTAIMFQEEFLPEDTRRRIAYAVKANSHSEILRILAEAGIASFDCASIGEIEKVKSVSKNPEIFFNHPHKKRKEIQAALDQGVHHFTADLRMEVAKILSVMPEDFSPEIAVRLKTLNPDGAMINISEKFGASMAEAQKMFHYLKQSNAESCISMNVGSQVLDIQSYQRNFKQVIDLIQSMRMRVKAVNIGGGIPVLLDKSVEENQEILRQYLRNMTQVLQGNADTILTDSEDAKIIIEPGRSMIASSVDLAISILNTHKEENENILVIDDGLFTSFSDIPIHNWKYVMQGIDAQGNKITNRKDELYNLYGRTCDSRDIIRDQLLTRGLTSKDYLHIPNAGMLSSKNSDFNGYAAHRYVIYNP